jgi:hypothetical protein
VTDPRKFKAPFNPKERIWQEADKLRAAHPAGRSLPVQILDLAEFDLGLDLIPVDGLREQLDIDALLMGEDRDVLHVLGAMRAQSINVRADCASEKEQAQAIRKQLSRFFGGRVVGGCCSWYPQVLLRLLRGRRVAQKLNGLNMLNEVLRTGAVPRREMNREYAEHAKDRRRDFVQKAAKEAKAPKLKNG